jgi:3'-phosphoadenosine 5'-phosphosulfate (PAPS) 3'-phosphatase
MNDIPAAVAHEKGYKQWDVAAGHAILKAAGGELVLAETRQPLSYAYVPDDDYRVPGCYGASLSVLQTLGLLTSAPPRER